MTYETVLLERRGDVSILTLNRPEKLNALSPQLMLEMTQALAEANDDPASGAIVITGAGRAFCAGADLTSLGTAQPAGDAAPARQNPLERWVQFVRSCKPVVCAVNGPAIGAGLSMTLACDARLASTAAVFSARFVKVAIVPELGSSQLLPQIVGLGTAVDWCLSGRNFDASEALRAGLVCQVVEPDALLTAALSLASEYAENPPNSLLEVKGVLYANYVEPDIATARARELAAVGRLRGTDEQKEAIRAFRERRAPRFRNIPTA